MGIEAVTENQYAEEGEAEADAGVEGRRGDRGDGQGLEREDHLLYEIGLRDDGDRALGKHFAEKLE